MAKSETTRVFGVGFSTSSARSRDDARAGIALPEEETRQAPQARPVATLSERREFLERLVGVRVSEPTSRAW